MPKIEDQSVTLADEETEERIMNKRLISMAVIMACAILCIIVAIAGSTTPEAQKTRANESAQEERRRKVEAETQRSYKLFKEAEELQKMRPLNSVEERVVKDYARQAAEQRVPR